MNQAVQTRNDGVLRVAEYEAWLDASGISASTKRAYVSRMRNFAAFVNSPAGSELAESFESAVLSYVVELRKKDKTATSIRCFLVAVKSYCRFRNLPQPQVKVSRLTPAEARVLDAEQQSRLLQILDDGCSNRDRALVALVLLSGLRTGECARLNVKDISSDGRTLYLAVRNENGFVDRSIPLSSITRRYMAAWILERQQMNDTADDALFVSAQGKRLHANSIRWLIAKAGEMLGADLNPQILRSSFIANLVSKVDDYEVIGELSGIRSPERIGHFLRKRQSVDKVAAVELACAGVGLVQVMQS